MPLEVISYSKINDVDEKIRVEFMEQWVTTEEIFGVDSGI